MRVRCEILAFALAALILIGGSRAATAAAITFTGKTSSSWSDATNWSPMAVPGAGDTAVIPSSE